jgi:hypothetical protein
LRTARLRWRRPHPICWSNGHGYGGPRAVPSILRTAGGGDRRRGFQPAAIRVFRSLTPLAKAITIILGLNVVAELLVIVNTALTIEVMGRLLAQAPYTDSELSAVDRRNMALAVLSILVLLAAGYVSCRWSAC